MMILLKMTMILILLVIFNYMVHFQIYRVLGVPDMGWRYVDCDYITTTKGCHHTLPIESAGSKPYPDPRYSLKVARMLRNDETFISNAGCLALNVHEAICRLERGRQPPPCSSEVTTARGSAPRWGLRPLHQDSNTTAASTLCGESSGGYGSTISSLTAPTDSFGWVVTGERKSRPGCFDDMELWEIIAPVNSQYGGRSFWVNPEEVVFNLHTWVELTYNTQPLDGVSSLMGASESLERQAFVDRVNAEMQFRKQHPNGQLNNNFPNGGTSTTFQTLTTCNTLSNFNNDNFLKPMGISPSMSCSYAKNMTADLKKEAFSSSSQLNSPTTLLTSDSFHLNVNCSNLNNGSPSNNNTPTPNTNNNGLTSQATFRQDNNNNNSPAINSPSRKNSSFKTPSSPINHFQQQQQQTFQPFPKISISPSSTSATSRLNSNKTGVSSEIRSTPPPLL